MLILTLLLAGWAQAAPAPSGDGDLQIIKQRIHDALLAPTRQPRDLPAQPRQHLAALRPDGTWPDIDYADKDRAGWKPAQHVYRLLQLAKTYRTRGQELFGDAKLKAAILQAFDAWVRLDLKCPNWWYNQIGVPTTLGEFLILMEKDLSPEQRAAGIAILKRATWQKWTGQNLVWGTSIQVVRGCLENSPPVLSEAYDRMYQEIRIAPDGHEGIQADFSFHQHGPLLYVGGYGAGFTHDCARFVELAHGTAYAIAPQSLRILEGYVLDGQQWMIRASVYDYVATGRELTRKGKNAASLASALERLARLGGPRREEFANFARRLKNDPDATPLFGNRHFWRSDYMAHHREAYFTSARMYSTRLLNNDGFINGENKKSHHLADGANLLYLTGQEYKDIFPVWDWLRIPGTTCEQNTPLVPSQVNQKGLTRFVGGVSDGTHGLAAMHLKRGQLEARKAFFFFDDEYVCLGAGITCPTDNPVYTAINQCWLKGPVTTSLDRQPLAPGQRLLKDVLWVHHDSVGYIFPDKTSLIAANQPQTGAWSDIGVGPSTPVTGEVFSLTLDHGPKPTDASYAYVVVPNIQPRALAAHAQELKLKILANTPKLQAIHHEPLNLTAIVFAQPGTLELAPGQRVTVDQPCLLLLTLQDKAVQIALSNPENQPLAVNLDIDLPLEGPGATQTAPTRSRVRFDLPGGLSAGRSIVRVLKIKNKP